MTFGSLFAGIGGIDLGFERAGMECAWQVENNEYCNKVLAKHWPNVPRFGDILRFPPPAWIPCPDCDNYLCTYHNCHAHDCPEDECPLLEVWDENGLYPYADFHPLLRPDIICGGDPCQANSKASAPSGSRTASLGGEFIRVVDAIRPRFVLRENPPARTNAPWTWQRFRRELESLGYAVMPFRLRACCFGADHRRERVFLLGALGDAESNRLDRRHIQGANGRRQPKRVQAPIQTRNWPHVPRPRGFRSRNGIPAYVERMRALGNAVVPQVAEWIGRRLLDASERR